MLKVKPDRASVPDPMDTARYVDEANVAGRPLELRVDGRPPLTVAEPRARRLLWQLVEHIETVAAVQEALEQVERGEGRPAEEFFEEMRAKYGIPRDE
jgi:hypothetical protein